MCYTDIVALANDWVTLKPLGVHTILFVQKATSAMQGLGLSGLGRGAAKGRLPDFARRFLVRDGNIKGFDKWLTLASVEG